MRKAGFPLRMSGILFAAKHSWTALLMSSPLFVSSYLQVTCRPMKRKKNLLRMIITFICMTIITYSFAKGK